MSRSSTALCLAIVVVLLAAGGGSATTTKPLYVQADRLFTGTTLISGRVGVVVKGGKVVAAGRLRIPTNARVIRLRGATILPGIIDLHVHETRQLLLRAGVTTTRNLGEPEAVLRPPFAARRYPRIVSAGPIITVPGGYPTGRDPGISAPVRSAQEGAAKVDALVAKGAALIKISLGTGANGTLPTLGVGEIQAIVGRAHKLGRIVTAHVLDGKGLALALSGGVDEIAHMPCAGVTSDQIAALVERRIAVVSTLHVAAVLGKAANCPDAMANARAFVEQGGKLLYGTDMPSVRAGLNLIELRLMQQAGLTAAQVLKAATAAAGKELGMAPLGTLVPGAPADLWAVSGNPTRSLGALGHPVYVMARGRRVR